MRSLRDSGRVRVVSFSGVDGAGKSTQIERLCECLNERGVRIRLFRFWDDIARLKKFREGAGHKLFKGDKGVGTPSAPISRRDKNVRSWPMTCFRMLLYVLDAVSVRPVLRKSSHFGVDLVIFDRYIYDEFANLNLGNPLIRAYIRLMMWLVPRPDVSFLLDADPAEARARKPEYPLDFIRINRQSYIKLSQLVGGMTVVPPMPIPDVQQEILAHLPRAFSLLVEQSVLVQKSYHDRSAKVNNSRSG